MATKKKPKDNMKKITKESKKNLKRKYKKKIQKKIHFKHTPLKQLSKYSFVKHIFKKNPDLTYLMLDRQKFFKHV
jgi:hypothetical protein